MASSPTHYVLVHGAFSDATIWNEVAKILESDGSVVVAPTLPGHGADRANAGSATLATYVETVTSAIGASPEPVVLVGHSLAGMSVAAATEQVPERIAAAVYVCAFLPEAGMTANDYAQADTASVFTKNFTPHPDDGIGTVTSEGLREAIFNASPESVAGPASANPSPEPLQPFGTPVEMTEARSGSVPRFYVHTTKDRAVTPGAQHKMVAAMPVRRAFTVEADHGAPASAPAAVARAIREAAATVRTAVSVRS